MNEIEKLMDNGMVDNKYTSETNLIHVMKDYALGEAVECAPEDENDNLVLCMDSKGWYLTGMKFVDSEQVDPYKEKTRIQGEDLNNIENVVECVKGLCAIREFGL